MSEMLYTHMYSYKEFQYIMLRNHPVLHLYQESNCGYSTGTKKRKRQNKEEGEKKKGN